VAGIQGLSGLYGPAQNVAYGETGRPADNWGGPVDKRHGKPGDASRAAPGASPVSPYAPEIHRGDPTVGGPLPGLTRQNTPDVHSSPYPRGMTQDLLVAAQQMRDLHGEHLGGDDLTFLTPNGLPYDQHLSANGGLFTDSPNNSGLADKIPGQLRSGDNGNDVDQGFGTKNGYGFEFGRLMKRWFSDPVPTDYTGTSGGERPFLGHHRVWQNRLDNNSQFGAAGDISVRMQMSDTPTGEPTPWEQPANPTYRTTTDYPDESGLIGNEWMAG
jgi:hypothetical protein